MFPEFEKYSLYPKSKGTITSTNTIVMNKQVITDMFLTKEAMLLHVKNIREKQAAEYGLSLEQYEQAIVSGSVITPLPPKQ